MAARFKPTPCHRKRIFTAPSEYPPAEVERAAQLCLGCPVRVECARAALRAGDTVDGRATAPASEVIQAGVICGVDQVRSRGVYLKALAEVAGVPVPRYRSNREGYRDLPDECVACGSPLARWSRDPAVRARYEAEGLVMQHARGYCVGCRPAYRRHLQTVDRKRITGIAKLHANTL